MYSMRKKIVKELKLPEYGISYEKAKLVVPNKLKVNKNNIGIKYTFLYFSIKIQQCFEKMISYVVYLCKNAKENVKKQLKMTKKQYIRGIMGIGQLFVVVSIIYSTFIVQTFVDTDISLAMIVPQAIFALYTLLKAFYKLYK